MKPRVVVAGPGAPEMLHMAEALAEADALRAYIAPFAPTRSEVESSPLQKCGPVGRVLISQLRRRIVSDEVGHSDRYQAARAADIAATAALRLGLAPRVTERLADWRNQAIQTSVARMLDPSDTDLLVPAGAALRPLEQARRMGIRGWLDCPTTHHRYAARLLTEELRLVPDFAPTMQYPASSRRVAEQLDREIERADDLIVLSTFQQRTFEAEGVVSKRLHLVPLGVDVDVFRPMRHAKNTPFTIGFVGQVTQRKGISYLVAAFEALRVSDARLLVVGRPVGPRRPWLRQGVEHQLPVARSRLPEVYARMDAFVLPSLIEGFRPDSPRGDGVRRASNRVRTHVWVGPRGRRGERVRGAYSRLRSHSRPAPDSCQG